MDEATFDKKTLAPWELSTMHNKAGKNTVWEQWGGLVEVARKPWCWPSSTQQSRFLVPGPGAMRKVDWKPLAAKWLQGRHVILHSDSARSYRLKVPGMLHDAVAHQKKRIKRGAKYVWMKPNYVRISTHTLPDGRKIKTKAGTQIIDRAWRFIEERLRRNQQAKATSPHVLPKSAVLSMNTGIAMKTSVCARASSCRSTWKGLLGSPASEVLLSQTFVFESSKKLQPIRLWSSTAKRRSAQKT